MVDEVLLRMETTTVDNLTVDLPPEEEAKLLSTPTRSSDLITADDINTALTCSHSSSPLEDDLHTSLKNPYKHILATSVNAGIKKSCIPMMGCLSSKPLKTSGLSRLKTRPLFHTNHFRNFTPLLLRTRTRLPPTRTQSTNPFTSASSLNPPPTTTSSSSHIHYTSVTAPSHCISSAQVG